MKTAIALSCMLLACQKPSERSGTLELESEEQKLGYVIGVDIGARLKASHQKVDFQALLKGIENVYLDQPRLIGEDSIRTLQARFQKAADEYEKGIQARRSSHLAFLEENQKSKDVVALPNGLQYQILKAGNGNDRPAATAVVKCHLKGYMPDGTVLEDSYSEDEPRTMEVGKTIEGIKAALLLMNPGMKLKVWIPSPLAYGRQGKGDAIPEYALLVYEVELLEIMPPTAPS